jgi:hypothetical protein
LAITHHPGWAVNWGRLIDPGREPISRSGAVTTGTLTAELADQIGGSGAFMAAVAATLGGTVGAAMQRRSMVGVDAGLE